MTAQTHPVEFGRYQTSEQMFNRAKEFMPGGVNSPVRSFGSVGGTPVFMAGAEGAVLQDMDANQYVDYVGSWGPMILGHANPKVLESIKMIADLSTSFGAPTDRETALADHIIERHKAVDMVRLVNSGTEATMSAIRLARGYTGKKRIIKCDGCYHGHVDSLLVAAGSGAASCGIPGSAGVPEELANLTTVVPYNDLDAVEKVFGDYDDIAALIIEPVAGNMGCIPPVEGYLKGLEELCKANGTLLIFDEVMTGFRLSYGSAQELYDIDPDITCFGKIIGGGLPLAAYGGKKDIMQHIAPLGPVYQAGTLSGNPLAVSAGVATVEQLNRDLYATLEDKTKQLVEGLGSILTNAGIPHASNRVGSMFTIFFSEKAPQNFEDVQQTDLERFKKFFHAMLEEGVYLPPSAFEASFVSTAHTDELINFTLEAAQKAIQKIK